MKTRTLKKKQKILVKIFYYISNKMQCYTVYLYLETAVHVSGGTSTHHQERKQLRKILIFWFVCEIIFQYISKQDATLHSLFISGNCSTCFGWYLHPSSGAQTTKKNPNILIYIRNYISIYIQQDATLHSLFISGNCCTCFGWYLPPSSGAQTTKKNPNILIYIRNYISIYIQKDATLHSLFISGNCSKCFGWYLHPSPGAQTTVSTASDICQTVTATCRYSGR